MSNLKFSESGVRGVIGETLTPKLLAALALAFGRYVGGGTVAVGRDTRHSGIMAERAVVAGLLAAGCKPILLGITPTPTVEFMVRQLHAHGGIAITASHNPAHWNALKLIGERGVFLNRNEARELFDLYNQGSDRCVPEGLLHRVGEFQDAFALHQKHIFAHIDVEAIRNCHFKVAIDCCDGVGSVTSVGFLQDLGCEVIPLFTGTDGIFHRPPEPIAENLTLLRETVVKKQCAIGFAHDPDGDRMALIDNTGRALGTDATLMLPIAHILAREPSPIVVNCQSSMALKDIAEDFGVPFFYSKVGEINVVEKMIACGAEIGGEGSSAGLIWRKVNPARDAYVVMGLMLEMMACNPGKTVAELFDVLPHYHYVAAKVEASPCAAREAIIHLAQLYAKENVTRIDGVRVDFSESWFLVRQSNTERVLRVNAEAKNLQRAEELLKTVLNEIQPIIDHYDRNY